MMPLTRAAQTDSELILWDFSTFTEKVLLTDATVAPQVDYNGLTIVGAVTEEEKDYITSEGIHFNGTTKDNARHVILTLSQAGVLSVNFRSNSSTARTCYIADTLPASSYLASTNAVEGIVQVSLQAGTYYIGMEAAITITSIMFTPL